MNKHVFTDRLTATVGALVAGKMKFFSESLQARSFREYILESNVSMPPLNREQETELKTDGHSIALDPALKVEKWIGADHPTILYNHGNNERPFDYSKNAKNTFYHIFVKNNPDVEANLIVIRAPFHNCSIKEYQQKISRLENFMIMIATTVAVNQAVILQLKKLGCHSIIVSGISLGGWVSNLHRTHYNSADAYAPLMAGAYLGELFLQSRYKNLTAEKAKQQSEIIREKLNFNKDFELVSDDNLYPLLARYDQFIEYNVQKRSYNGSEIHLLENGHVTGALNSRGMRDHLLAVIQNVKQKH